MNSDPEVDPEIETLTESASSLWGQYSRIILLYHSQFPCKRARAGYILAWQVRLGLKGLSGFSDAVPLNMRKPGYYTSHSLKSSSSEKRPH